MNKKKGENNIQNTIQYFLNQLQLRAYDVLGIDGPCGSGKTTLAHQITSEHDVDVIQMDDFYLPFELRTKERLGECGGNVHHERFLEEVVVGIKSRKEFSYRKFSCQEMDYVDTITVSNIRPIIIEGSYCMRPELCPIYTKKIYLQIDSEIQKARLINRVGKERFYDFETLWIPKEKEYIEYFQIKENADIILNG